MEVFIYTIKQHRAVLFSLKTRKGLIYKEKSTRNAGKIQLSGRFNF